MQDYYVEITDTFAGEANYSWVTRYKVTSTENENDAIIKISNESGINWIKQWDDGTFSRYNSESGLTCLFISEYCDDEHVDYHVSVIS